jgi:hypothetical protein
MAKPEYPPIRPRAMVYKGPMAATRLLRLDPTLTPQIFTTSFDFGIAQANQTLTTEPTMAFGSTRFYKTSGMMRANLQDASWTLIDIGNHALSVNEAGTLAIVACSGDEFVDIDDPLKPDPQPRNPKGLLIRRAVETNIAVQQSLADAAPGAGFPRLVKAGEEGSVPPEATPWVTWVFMYTQDPLTGEPRAELSLPDEMVAVGTQGHVRITGWVERIFIENFETGPGKGWRQGAEPDVEPDAPIDVPVERRVG